MTAKVFIQGDAYVGWETLTVSRSIEDAVSTASFSGPLRWPNDPNPTRIRPGDAVQIFDDDDQMLQGFGDAISIDSEVDGEVVSVDARSDTADLADCSVVTEPYAWKQKTMLEIAQLLTLPYQVTVVDSSPPGTTSKPVDFRAELGEPVFDAIERLAQDAGVLVTDNGKGELVVAKSGVIDDLQDLPTLKYGVNVTSASGVFRHDQRYRFYRIYGQRPGNNADSGSAVSLQRVIVEDPEVDRFRVLALSSSNMANLDQLKARGTWEAVTRAGRSVELSYGVVGWRRPDGHLWAPGQIVLVDDAPRAVNAAMIISSVTWSEDQAGQTARLSVAPSEGFNLMATVDEIDADTGTSQKLSKPVTPGSDFGLWFTAEQVAAIKARSGK